MAQYIQIKNPETNVVETKEVATILSHLANLTADPSTAVAVELPVHTMLHAVRKVDNNSGDSLTCEYRVTFENRLLRVRQQVLSNRLPTVLKNRLRITANTEGLYVTERIGLAFTIRITTQTNSVSPTRIKHPNSNFKVLPNVYDDSRLCFGNTRFNTENQSSATVFADVGRMLQSFFASTFNSDLSSTGYRGGDAEIKRRTLEFLRLKGHRALASDLEGVDVGHFGCVYTFWAIASITGESLSEFQRLAA